MSESGKAVVVTEAGEVPRLAEIHALRDAGSDDYWRSPAVQAEQIALIDAERHPATQALKAIAAVERDADDWAGLAATFDQMTPAIHSAVADELMFPAPTAGSATWEDLETFRRVPAGSVMAREWREAAPYKLGVVRARTWAILDRLAEPECGELLDWLNACPTQDQVAVLRLLAG
jgi:hypothetical protein